MLIKRSNNIRKIIQIQYSTLTTTGTIANQPHLQRARILAQHLSSSATHIQSPTMPPPPPTSPIPKWKHLLQKHIQQSTPSGTPEFSLATLAPISITTSSATQTHYRPRVRTLVFRGFWLELPKNEKNPYWGVLNRGVRELQEQELRFREGKEKGNKEGSGHDESSSGMGEQGRTGTHWQSEIITFTTDVRMHKVREEIFPRQGPGAASSGAGNNTSGDSNLPRTGGGAHVEACFWFNHPDVQTQWRVRGRCWLLALEDINNSAKDIKEIKHELENAVYPPSSPAETEISYIEEILAHFTNLSPMLRGSFAPPPGSPPPTEAGNFPGQPLPPNYNLPENSPDNPLSISNEDSVPVELQHLGPNVASKKTQNTDDNSKRERADFARRNFRVGCIIPEEVERLELSARGGAGRRWVYSLEGEGEQGGEQGEEKRTRGKWVETEVWP